MSGVMRNYILYYVKCAFQKGDQFVNKFEVYNLIVKLYILRCLLFIIVSTETAPGRLVIAKKKILAAVGTPATQPCKSGGLSKVGF
jgi:hypothetical protein